MCEGTKVAYFDCATEPCHNQVINHNVNKLFMFQSQKDFYTIAIVVIEIQYIFHTSGQHGQNALLIVDVELNEELLCVHYLRR